MKKLLPALGLAAGLLLVGAAILMASPLGGCLSPNNSCGWSFSVSHDVQPSDGLSSRVQASRQTLCASYNMRVIASKYDTVTGQSTPLVNWLMTPSAGSIHWVHDFPVDHNDVIGLGAYLIQTEFPPRPSCNFGSNTATASIVP